MEEHELKLPLKKYVVDVDGEMENLEIWAEFIDLQDGTLSFICDHHTVAQFMTWRYWTYEGNVYIPTDHEV
jgi:inorganic pyrophosphatase/exopolyphosphatase